MGRGRVLTLWGKGCPPGGLFQSEACLACSRALPREPQRSQGPDGRRGASRLLPALAGAYVSVRTVGKCRECARHGWDVRQVKIPHKTQAPGLQRASLGKLADAQGHIHVPWFSELTLSRCTKRL